MKKNLVRLLIATLAINLYGGLAALAIRNPLAEYSLRNDVMRKGSDRERITSEFSGSSLQERNKGEASEDNEKSQESEYQAKQKSLQEVIDNATPGETIGPRNKDLRESSQRVYSDFSSTDPWMNEIAFYSNPSFEGIKMKYKQSNFAGALQESISYIKHPNFRTLSRERKTMAYYYLAMCYTKCGQRENAIRAYERVISLHDSPMIVKYATNGRNCVLEEEKSSEKCYPNVNVPELVYPYQNIAEGLSSEDLTPVDPEILVNRNIKSLQEKLYGPEEISVPTNQNGQGNESQKPGDGKENTVTIPFGVQDAELDKFINAPYGNGLSPNLNNEYKQLQLRKLQQEMNIQSNDEDKNKGRQNAQEFDKSSDSGTIKIAYDADATFENLEKNPEYIRQKQELEEISRLFGNDTQNKSDDIMDLIPYMTENGEKKLSPEVIQSLMMKSLMGNITL